MIPDSQTLSTPADAPLADPARLAAMAAMGLLDSPPGESSGRLTRMASEFLQAPVAPPRGAPARRVGRPVIETLVEREGRWMDEPVRTERDRG